MSLVEARCAARRPCRAIDLGGSFECVGGRSVGLVVRDTPSGGGGGRLKAWRGQQLA
jgi:hypothetical protein